MISPDLRFRTRDAARQSTHSATRHRHVCLVGRTRPRCRNAGGGLLHFKGRPPGDDASHRSRQERLHSLIECSDRRAPGETESAICVQRLDDSLNSAIHTRYRSLLRSSSMHEPRGPPLEVVQFCKQEATKWTEKGLKKKR